MKIVFLVGAMCLALCVAVQDAAAQPSRPERPNRALFGSGVADSGKLLTAQAGVEAGYDDDLSAEAAGSTRGIGPIRRQGLLSGVNGALSYTQSSDSVSFGAIANSQARYYPSLEQHWLVGSQARATASFQLGGRTQVATSTSVTYQPANFLTLLPRLFDPQVGESTLADLDLAVGTGNYLAYDGDASVTHRLTRRMSLGAHYNYRTAELSGQALRFGSHGVGGDLQYSLGKGLGVHAGYTETRARLSDNDESSAYHQIDVGLDYTRALSISRRTTLSFTTGTSAVETGSTSDTGLRYRAIGSANLNREIGRTWNATLSYSRQVELSEVWSEPVFYDSVTVGTGGLLNRRLHVFATASLAVGQVGAFAGAGSFDSSFATTGLRYDLSRYMTAGLQYSFYHHRFADVIVLPEGTLQSSNRQSVRVHLTVGAPLFHRSRRTHATR